MKGRVVSNTGPIIALSAIDHLEILKEKGADFVLIDERKARKIARKIYGMPVVGSTRILVEAKRRGLISNVSEALQEMRKAGYWIHDDIIKKAMEQADE